MNEQLAQLAALLETIRSGAAVKHDPAQPRWHNNAVDTILDNVGRYRQTLAQALASGSPADAARAAGQVAGIRKGVLDLGVLDAAADRPLLAAIDQADTLAVAILSELRS